LEGGHSRLDYKPVMILKKFKNEIDKRSWRDYVKENQPALVYIKVEFFHTRIYILIPIPRFKKSHHNSFFALGRSFTSTTKQLLKNDSNSCVTLLGIGGVPTNLINSTTRR